MVTHHALTRSSLDRHLRIFNILGPLEDDRIVSLPFQQLQLLLFVSGAAGCGSFPVIACL